MDVTGFRPAIDEMFTTLPGIQLRDQMHAIRRSQASATFVGELQCLFKRAVSCAASCTLQAMHFAVRHTFGLFEVRNGCLHQLAVRGCSQEDRQCQPRRMLSD